MKDRQTVESDLCLSAASSQRGILAVRTDHPWLTTYANPPLSFRISTVLRRPRPHKLPQSNTYAPTRWRTLARATKEAIVTTAPLRAPTRLKVGAATTGKTSLYSFMLALGQRDVLTCLPVLPNHATTAINNHPLRALDTAATVSLLLSPTTTADR